MSTNNAKKVANWDEEVTDIVPKKVDSWDEEVSDEPVKKKASSEATSGVPTLLKPPTKESTLQSEQGGLDFSQTPSEILAKETPKEVKDTQKKTLKSFAFDINEAKRKAVEEPLKPIPLSKEEAFKQVNLLEKRQLAVNSLAKGQEQLAKKTSNELTSLQQVITKGQEDINKLSSEGRKQEAEALWNSLQPTIYQFKEKEKELNSRLTKLNYYDKRAKATDQEMINISEGQQSINNQWDRLNAGLNTLSANFLRSPQFAYNTLIAAQNKIAREIGLPEAPYQEEGYLSNMAKYFEQNADAYHKVVEKKQKQTDYDIISLFKKGENAKALNLLLENIVESAPTTGAIAMGGVAGLTNLGTTIGGGLVFGAGTFEENKKKGIDDATNVVNSWTNGLLEGIFESTGTLSIINDAKNIFVKSGKEAVEESAKNIWQKVYGKAAEKLFPVTSAVKEGISEGETTFTQNIVNIVQGVDEEYNKKYQEIVNSDLDEESKNQALSELTKEAMFKGVPDAFLTGVGMGAILGGGAKKGYVAVDDKNRKEVEEAKKKFNEYATTLTNPTVSAEAKELIQQKAKEEADKIVAIQEQDDNDLKQKLTKEDYEAVVEIQSKISNLEKSIDNIDNEQSKAVVYEQVNELNKEKAEILKREIKQENEIRSTDNNIPKQVESPQQEIKLTPIEVIAGKEQGDGGVAKVVQGDGQVEQAPKTKEEIADEIELKNEGKAEAPTKESVTERLNINNPFYQKVEDALVKLGLIEKYNPETGTGDVVGGYAQQTSDGGFSVGKMLFSQDGSISYFDGDVKVSFDKNGNVISENTKEAKQKAVSLEIEGKKQSIANLEKTRDSEAFKYKEVIETDVLGNKKKVKRLKTEQELKESTDKINAAIDKAKNEITELEQQYEKEPTKKEDGKPLSRGVQGVRIEGQAGKESAELRPEEEVALDIRSAKDIGDIQINDINSGNVVIGYHATPTGEIGTGKELGIHIGTEDVSNNIKKGRNSNKGDVKKVAFRVNKPLILGDMPSWSSVNVLNEMMRQKLLGIDKEKLREIRDSDLSEKEKQQRIIELAKEKGYDSFAYQNFDEGNGEFSYVLFDDSKLNDITPKEAKATPQAGSVVGGEVNFTEVEDKKIKDIATEANLKVGSYVRSVPTGKKNKFGNSINEYEATNPFTNEKITFKKQGDATDYVVKEIAKATTKSGREEIFKAVEQSLKETPQEVKASTPEKVQEEAKPLTKEKELLKQKKIEGTLFTEKESQDYQKEIESKYNDSDTPISKRFGQENEDIRQKLFNYDNPIAQKEVNGVDVRIAEGLVEGEPYLGKRRKTYLLYADGKIAGKFYSVNDAKKVVKFIEDNLVKTIASPQQKLQAPKIETNEKDKQAVGDNTSTESKGNLKDSKSPKSPKRKRVSKGASPRVKNALSIESGDLRHKVMQYFIGGGKINTSVFQKLFGKAGDATLNKAARSEANQRFGLWNNKKGLSINQLAHKLWEDNGGAYNESNPTDDVYREAVEEVVLRYNGTRAMIDELNNINMFTEETQSLTEEERFAMEEEKYYRNSLTDEEEALYDLNLAEEVWQSLTDEQKLALIKDQIEAEELVNQYDAIQGKKEAIESEIKANDERIGKIKKSLDDEAKKEQGNLFGGGMQAPKMFNTAEGLGTELKALERKNEALKSQLEELQPQEEVKNQAKIDFDNKLTETEKAIDVYKRLSENNDTSTRKEYKALPESIKRVLDNIVNIHKQLEEKNIITKKGNCP